MAMAAGRTDLAPLGAMYPVVVKEWGSGLVSVSGVVSVLVTVGLQAVERDRVRVAVADLKGETVLVAVALQAERESEPDPHLVVVPAVVLGGLAGCGGGMGRSPADRAVSDSVAAAGRDRELHRADWGQFPAVGR